MTGRTQGGRSRPEFDWETVRQRMESARLAIEQATSPTADTVRRVLHSRAMALARVPETGGGEQIEVLQFRLAHEDYAIETRHVREVRPLEHLSRVPCTPAHVLGIVHLRGEVLSVVDIRRFFDLPERGLTDLNKLVVLESPSMAFAILADAIDGVRGIPTAGMQPSIPALAGLREEYLRGVTPERLIVLDAERLLADRRLVVSEQVAG